MLTQVEIIACRDKLREADVLLSQVRGAFLVAQSMHGARIANDVLGLIADILRELDWGHLKVCAPNNANSDKKRT